MNNFKVALLQLLPEKNIDDNLKKGIEYCKIAKEKGADIALLPESARILMLKGAEIILVPNACPMEINRLSQLRSRAFENMVGIATVNYPVGKEDCNGHSTAFDGMAYALDNSGSRDTCIIDAGETEGVYIAGFPVDEIRAYRKSEAWGNAYRRPKKYGLLVSNEINEPFVR